MDGNKQTAYFHQHQNMEITDRLVSIDLLGAGQSWSLESESDWRPRPEDAYSRMAVLQAHMFSAGTDARYIVKTTGNRPVNF